MLQKPEFPKNDMSMVRNLQLSEYGRVRGANFHGLQVLLVIVKKRFTVCVIICRKFLFYGGSDHSFNVIRNVSCSAQREQDL